MANNNKGSDYLKFRTSTTDSSKAINDRGDFVKAYSSNHFNVNGQHCYSTQSAAKAIDKLGKK